MTSNPHEFDASRPGMIDTGDRFDKLPAAPLASQPHSVKQFERLPHVEIQVQPLFADRYQLLEKIGSGGMALLYAGKDLMLGRKVAIKLLDRSHIDATAIRRFQQEAKAASLLHHPNLVTVHDFGQDGARPFLVMDLIEGEALTATIRREGQLDQMRALEIALAVCAGLAHAHAHGVIHRDIKPGNIMLTKDDSGQLVPKIVDFGIAKTLSEDGAAVLTQTGEVFGSPAYMSPEQCEGKRIDARSDIYSLGCTLFEMLTANPPFSSDSVLNLLIMQREQNAPSLNEAALGKEFPHELECIMTRLLAKDPELRYQNIDEVVKALTNFKDAPAIANPSCSSPDASKQEAKSKQELNSKQVRLGLLFASAMISAASGCLYWMWQHPYQYQDAQHTKNSATTATTSHSTPVTMQGPGSSSQTQSVIATTAPFGTTFGQSHNQPIKRDPRARYLEFPDTSIGTISLIDAKSQSLSQPMPAKGTMRFRKADSLYLQASWVATENFSIFKKLQPDDLSSLSLANLPISDMDLDNITHLTGLDGLHLYDDDELTDEAVDRVLKLTKLRSLVLSGTNITKGGVARLAALKSLKVLKLDRIVMDKTALKAVATLPKLYFLSLGSTHLQDSDLENLAAAKSLFGLNLQSNKQITDQGVRWLASNMQLYELDLNGCGITPESIKYFKQMRFLKVLTVDLSTWTVRDRKALVSALPKCWITSSH